MTLFDLPFAPIEDGRYALIVNHGTPLFFSTRHAALAHAMAQAGELAVQGLVAGVNVEGGDGVWRLVSL